ncbi:Ribosomal RNA large subunit methyltransferase J [Candidatus Terasakiella magnetica]|uniref:Ribosomal RNA large subunit methyltransferase J n=1 Tax=Candidatus Terasakiella magnetica TaxID=1867952 RepID=A0A1C3RKH1_9PROT|nr:23S rRNA (adenine(2030)-N(6))-methyltransferase RlmJ [Candidatus Terasakiella magnetica]SCA57743.1 Ribosomal RNA large subunit methyltransferase J [Candidatus Terasakiella magnetica]
MLSYQHGYHAGNFADVHKHTALCLVLEHYGAQSKLVTYVDSHSGRGLYDLSNEQAEKTGEWKSGFGALKDKEIKSPALSKYLETINSFEGNIYPGSPALMQKMMAPNHHGVFFEFHPQEHEELKNSLGEDKRLRIVYQDALEGLVNYLPARKAAGLVLIDPSFELKEEYTTIAKLAISTHKRWPSATLLVWYPLLPENRHEELKARLKGASFYELIGPEKERGMYGTGLAVYNAPDGFDSAFREAEAEMQKLLFG